MANEGKYARIFTIHAMWAAAVKWISTKLSARKVFNVLSFFVCSAFIKFNVDSCSVCSFDNSDYQRNGDYFPTRLNVQKDGINLIGMSKLRANPENNVGFLTYARWVAGRIANVRNDWTIAVRPVPFMNAHILIFSCFVLSARLKFCPLSPRTLVVYCPNCMQFSRKATSISWPECALHM